MPAPGRKPPKIYDYASRHYVVPIGPSTPLIKPIDFLNASKLTLERSKIALEEIKARLNKLGDDVKKNIEERCSVESLYESNTVKHGNEHYKSELEKWHEGRLFPGDRKNEEVPPEVEDENEEGQEKEVVTAPAKKSRKRKAAPKAVQSEKEVVEGAIAADPKKKVTRVERISTLPCNDPEILSFLAEAEKSELKILKPLPDLEYFLRKTKMADFNTLPETRRAEEVISTKPPKDSPLNSLVYTITIQPVSQKSAKYIPDSTRSQVMILLGSSTLWEFVENFLVGGDEIPAELPRVLIDSDSDGDDDDEDNEKRKKNNHFVSQLNDVKGKGKAKGLNGGEDESKSRVRWGNLKRNVGCVLGIEGVLYADGREIVTDYADMVINSIDATEWNGKKSNKDRDNTPHWSIGTKMQDTCIGSLALKVGQPYWFMQQGNCEHIWTVDSIRHLHSNDTPLLDPNVSTLPYPISTFLSRLVTAKCRICDRDPGCIVTIDDELAGESPSLMCTKCFAMLHGDDGVGSKLNVIPKLIE